MSKVINAGKDKQGQQAFGFKLEEEHHELLRMLEVNQGWRLYRELLIGIKQSYLEMAMPSRDALEIKEMVSIAAGVNLAINQLGVLIASLNKKSERVKGES